MSRAYQPLATKQAYLDALQREVNDLKSVSRRIRELAIAARAAGASWTELGDTLGVSKQAAQQRYGRI